MSSQTSFYIQKPLDEHWNVGMPNWIFEAREIASDEGQTEWKKTQFYVQNFLKIINPPELKDKYDAIAKDKVVECEGPIRRLSFEKYVSIYHSLYPKRALPLGWEQHFARKKQKC